MNKVALPISILVWINTIIVFFSSHLVAHELQPNIVNLQITKDHIRVDFTTNLEAYITGIDFSILDNTNDHDNEKYYGILRTLNKTELSNVFLENWGPFASSFTLISETGAKLDNLTFSSVEIENVDNIEVPRSSTISFTVKNPGISYLTFQASKNLGEIIFRQVGVENGITQYLLPGEKSNNISHETGSSLNGINTFFDYVPVGFTHILPKGLDHILFVLGLLFLTTRIRSLVLQISIFTVAHTVTLAISSLKILSLPTAIIEPLIAASIVYIAVENIFNSTLTKYRSTTIFFFGLLHGLGFASVLSEFGLPGQDFFWALLGFNVGVELGQITLVLVVFSLLVYSFKSKTYYRSYVTIPGSSIIGLFGAWWFIERTLLT